MSMESLGAILRRIAARDTWTAIDAGTVDYLGNPETRNRADGCERCGGAGWVRHRVHVTNPDFGKVFPCQCQEQAADRRQRIEALERYSNLGALRQATFENVIPDGLSEETAARQAFRNALNAAVSYAEIPEGWLTLVGPSGSGKTYLAAAIANRRIELGNPALFITAADLIDYLRSGFDDEADQPFIDLFEQVRNAPLLVLDDLPTRSSTPWTQERLFQLAGFTPCGPPTHRGHPARRPQPTGRLPTHPVGITRRVRADPPAGPGRRRHGAIHRRQSHPTCARG